MASRGLGGARVMIFTTLRTAMSDIWAFIGVRRQDSFSYKRMGEKGVILDRTLFAFDFPFPTKERRKRMSSRTGPCLLCEFPHLYKSMDEYDVSSAYQGDMGVAYHHVERGTD